MSALKSWTRTRPLATAAIGTLVAIAATTILDAIGFGINILALVPLFFLLWYLQGLSRTEIGLTWAAGVITSLLWSIPPWWSR